MDSKKCFRCGIVKELSHFYKHKQMGDGHLNKCKECTKKDTAKREASIRSTPEGVESERARHREKYHRLGYCEKQKEWDKNRPWKTSYKYKNLNRDLKNKGLLNNGEVAHHWNYNDEYLQDVFVMKLKYHKLIHTKLVFDSEHKIFLFNNIPLTNKYRHISAIIEIIGSSQFTYIKL